MDIADVQRFCLALPGATEDVKWKTDLTFCIGDKMFTVVGLEAGPAVMSFKCTPAEFGELTERSGIIPAPYATRYHWVALERFDTLGEDVLKRQIRKSYRHVFERLPKHLQEKLAEK